MTGLHSRWTCYSTLQLGTVCFLAMLGIMRASQRVLCQNRTESCEAIQPGRPRPQDLRVSLVLLSIRDAALRAAAICWQTALLALPLAVAPVRSPFWFTCVQP